MAKDYYVTLEVPRNASPEEIRERFRRLARDRHPDRFQGAERARAEVDFQAITEAFNVLSSPLRRRQHDFELARPEALGAASDAARQIRFYMEAGIQFYKDRNFVQAAEAFERATHLDPKNSQAWHHLAQSLTLQKRRLEDAARAIDRACELAPMKSEYLKLAGRLNAELGLVDKAERYYNEAITWGGEDPAVDQALQDLRGRGKKSRPGKSGKGG